MVHQRFPLPEEACLTPEEEDTSSEPRLPHSRDMEIVICVEMPHVGAECADPACEC